MSQGKTMSQDAKQYTPRSPMPTYIGTKIVRAMPMSRLAYNGIRNWELPKDENGEDEGYLVEYIDGGKANVPGFEGYVSWSPADVFKRAYLLLREMDFGQAIIALKAGQKVARRGWNGKRMHLMLIPRGWFVLPPASPADVSATIEYQPHILLKAADGSLVIWTASQTDLLASDWEIVR